MLILVTLFVVLNIADTILTLILLRCGGQEMNPLMKLFVGRRVWFAAVKVVGPAIIAVLIYQRGNELGAVIADSVFASVVIWNSVILTKNRKKCLVWGKIFD